MRLNSAIGRLIAAITFAFGMTTSAYWMGLSPYRELTAVANAGNFLYLHWRGDLLTKDGDYKSAFIYRLKAKELSQIDGFPQNWKALALTDLGTTQLQVGQVSIGRSNLELAVALYEKALGAEHLDTLAALGNLAEAYRLIGLYDKTIDINKRILSAHEKRSNGKKEDSVIAMGNLASAYFESGEVNNALPLEIRALRIAEESDDVTSETKITRLNNLAGVHGHLGNNREALGLQQRALKLSERDLGLSHPMTATILSNIGLTLIALQRADEALPIYMRCIEIQRKIWGDKHENVAAALLGLAFTELTLKQFEQANSTLQQSLRALERLERPNSQLLANILMFTAISDAREQKFDLAISRLHKSISLDIQKFGPENVSVATRLSVLSKIYKASGHPKLSILIGKKSINMFMAEQTQIATLGNDTYGPYLESRKLIFQNVAGALLDQLRFDEARKVHSLLKQKEFAEFTRPTSSLRPDFPLLNFNADESRVLGRWGDLSKAVRAAGLNIQLFEATNQVDADNEQKYAKIKSEFELARSEFEAYLTDLKTDLPNARSDSRYNEISREGNENKANNELRGFGKDVALLRYFVTSEGADILLTTSNGNFPRTVPANSVELNAKIDEFLKALQDPKSDPRPVSHALYELVIAPVASDLKRSGVKTVMLSLDGKLRYVPFGALFDGQKYIVEKYNLPLYSDMQKDAIRREVSRQWNVAALGRSKEYVGQGNAVGDSFPALPSVKVEIQRIVKSAAGGVLPGEAYIDEAFTEERLRKVSERNFDVLHLASHFQFSPGTEINSFLLLGDGQQLSLGDIRSKNFRFDHADLLTLSACNTGLGGGKDYQGNEIEGFGAIAQQQGAKAVLATLWRVEDSSTAVFMGNMYQLREEGNLAKIEALRQAQVSLMKMKQFSHPFYWAPFILMGNWK
jgi:CHAT domain-containing protein